MTAAHSDPSVLYHYTDAYGLLGIANPSATSWPLSVDNPEHVYRGVVKLLASDVRFMNDTAELRFGSRLLRERLDAVVADNATEQVYRELFVDMKVIFDEEHFLEWPLRCFASCFCEEGDLLSQWRGYAGGVGGFALGLSRVGLANRSYVFDQASKEPPFNAPSETTLKQVVYGEEAGRAAADETIQQLMISDFNRAVLADQRPELQVHRRSFAYTALFRTVATIKAKAFEEEREWRLFSSNWETAPLSIRARQRGLVPYAEIAVNLLPSESAGESKHDTSAHPTVVDLVVGPGPDQAEQVVAAKELMTITGRDPGVVRASEVTFRG